MNGLKAQTKEDVLNLAKEHNVKFVNLWFTDMLGVLKSFAITIDELEDSLDSGSGFDGSSVEGYRDIEESDMVALPDPETFQIMPWKSNDHITARMFCDVLTPGGKPYDGDPRYVLKKQLARAAEMGYKVYLGPELEYFYFKDKFGTEILDKGGYFFLTPTSLTENVRRETVLALEKVGIQVECDHHEVAPSQHEIDLKYDEALQMADKCQTYKMIVKEVASEHGFHASFMPKPIFGKNGSGMHVHQSIFRHGKNAMFDPNDKHYLSQEGKSYIAGLMRHAREFCLVTNQSINSYKRLVPGYEAPVYIAWSRANRSAMVRIPNIKPGKENATRAELRCPDPAGNPYLQFAVMIAAGLEGVQKKYELPAPVDRNIYELSKKELEELNIPTLPGSLGEAIELAEKSELVKKALGNHTFERLIEVKKMEWDRYRIQVTDYEIQKLLPLL